MKMDRNLFLKISFLIILPILFFSFFNTIFAANPGTIPASTDCSEDTSCALLDSDGSSINFGCANCNVSVSSSSAGITGYAWGENIGWINLAPDGVPLSLSSQGVISGWAWGENTGWINFNSIVNCDTNNNGFIDVACDGDDATTAVVDFKVTISKVAPKGQFNGWAWSENYGWIQFDCGVAGACVTTTWTTGGGGSLKKCSDGYDNDGDYLNNQDDPGCYTNPFYDSNGNLTGDYVALDDDETDPDDKCLNLVGEQLEIPENYAPDPTHLPLSVAWCMPTFLTVTITNPAIQTPPVPLVYLSADCVNSDGFVVTDCGGDGTTLPTFDIANFETNKIKATVTGGTPDNVEFFVDGISIGSLADNSVFLVSGNTYEVSWRKDVLCSENSDFLISVVVTKDTGIPQSAEDSITIAVGRPSCPPHATQCSDSENNDDDDNGNGIINDPEDKIDREDPGCWIEENGEYVYKATHDDEDPEENICDNTPQPEICTVNLCEVDFVFGCPGFCDLEENQSDTNCIIPIIPTSCFDTGTCNCEDDSNLPGCEEPGGEPDPCDIDPNAPGCFTPSIIAEIFPPTVVEQINLGLKIAATASVAVAGVISLATALFLNPLAAPELVLIPVRLWSLLLTALGVKKRRKPWGTVYDSITKQPLDPVYVSLRNLEGAEIASSITDIDGRYGFLVKPGVYKVVPRKTNYIFPSDKLSKAFRDEFYANLYFGDYINISNAGEVIVKNIPMDAVNFDWNEFEKNKKKLYKFYSKRELIIAKISNWLFGIGFAIAGTALIISPEKYNIIIFGAYVFMFIFRTVSFKLKAKGRLLDKDGSPLSFASVRAYAVDTNVEIAHQASDEMGRYHVLLPNGTYYVKVEKKNNDGSYSVVHTSNYFKVVHGVLNRVFNV